MKYIYVIIFFGLFASPCFSDEINENDLKFLENGDTNSASVVIMKVRQIYGKEGKNAILPVIPAVINRTMNDLESLESGKLEEGEGEFLGDLLWTLSIIGDERVEPVLLAAVLNAKMSSSDVPKGFLNIGKSTFPKILDILKSATDSTSNFSIQSRCNVIGTLQEMAIYDSTGTYFKEDDKKIIKEELLKSVKNKNEYMRIFSVSALGYFGDKSTIPVLTEVKNSDPFISKKGDYWIRDEAEKAIENIMK